MPVKITPTVLAIAAAAILSVHVMEVIVHVKLMHLLVPATMYVLVTVTVHAMVEIVVVRQMPQLVHVIMYVLVMEIVVVTEEIVHVRLILLLVLVINNVLVIQVTVRVKVTVLVTRYVDGIVAQMSRILLRLVQPIAQHIQVQLFNIC